MQMTIQELHHGLKHFERRIVLPVALVAATLCLAIPASGQVVAAGYQDNPRFWLGAEYSNMDASFPYQSNQRISGIGGFADLNLKGRVGLEGDARLLRFGGFESSTETSYLFGPKFLFRNFGRFKPYVKGLIGVGRIHYPFQIGDASYFAVAPGGGVSYKLSDRFAIRAEYEYQFWPDSPGYTNEPHHELTPNGINVGFSYCVRR